MGDLTMNVSIIIPTYNEEDYIENLLKSIKRQDYNDDIEVIVADAFSSDKTVEIAKQYDCIVVDGGLPAVGRNRGAEVATGEFLIFLDADSVLTDNYITQAIDEFIEDDLAIAITQIVPLEKGFINELSHSLANYMTRAISEIKPHGAGCYGILTYKSLHKKADGFDESIDFGEDTDYIERIAQMGNFKVLSNPRLLVSTRRLEEEGIKSLTLKYAKSTTKQLIGEKVTLEELDYSFDHEKKLTRKPRILYSLCGEGLGHAIRSAIVIKYLIMEGYDLIVFASDRAYKYLDSKFENVYEINGFNTVYENNTVRNKKTFAYNMKDVPSDLQENMNKMYKLAHIFKPDVVVSDFEFYANMLSHILHIPLVSVDNMHVLTEAKYSVPKRYMKDRIFAEAVVHAFIQNANKTLIYSYFYPPLKDDSGDVQYIQPLVREEISSLKPEIKDHILVYQTSDSNHELIELLKKNKNRKFIIYGFHKDEEDENLIFRLFSEEVLFNDLKDARCVITNGGFSFITEALTLKKPVLSIPVNKQFEQILNAIYLDKLGYGEHHNKITQEILDNFIDNTHIYAQNIEENYKPTPNNETLEIIRNTIESVVR